MNEVGKTSQKNKAGGFNLGEYNKARAASFDDSYIPEPNSGCWLWLRGANRDGYGQMTVNRRLNGAHRYSWIRHKGPIPEGLLVCHKCDTRLCVNPDHFFLGTPGDNTQDMLKKGRRPIRRGPELPWAKLTVSDIANIRNDARPHKTIADEYGVHYKYVGAIKRKTRWRHVP